MLPLPRQWREVAYIALKLSHISSGRVLQMSVEVLNGASSNSFLPKSELRPPRSNPYRLFEQFAVATCGRSLYGLVSLFPLPPLLSALGVRFC